MRMNSVIVSLPVNPPWVDFVHFTQCEDGKLFQCPDCHSLVPDSYLNICECNLKFIPRITECVCDELEASQSRPG